jgi:hypothetical protein
MRRMTSRTCESMHGLPGRRRERRLQHRRNPSRCQRPTVAGWTKTSASLHRGHNHRKHSQSRRSDWRKRRSERARTPSWWRRARLSRKRSLRTDRADWRAATVRMASRIACRMASSCANVNDSCPDAILAKDTFPRLADRRRFSPVRFSGALFSRRHPSSARATRRCAWS